MADFRENVNDAIRAPNVRAVFPDGTVEVMATESALRKAREFGLDLVVVSPAAEPPVARAVDYDQWRREQNRPGQ